MPKKYRSYKQFVRDRKEVDPYLVHIGNTPYINRIVPNESAKPYTLREYLRNRKTLNANLDRDQTIVGLMAYNPKSLSLIKDRIEGRSPNYYYPNDTPVYNTVNTIKSERARDYNLALELTRKEQIRDAYRKQHPTDQDRIDNIRERRDYRGLAGAMTALAMTPAVSMVSQIATPLVESIPPPIKLTPYQHAAREFERSLRRIKWGLPGNPNYRPKSVSNVIRDVKRFLRGENTNKSFEVMNKTYSARRDIKEYIKGYKGPADNLRKYYYADPSGHFKK